jgi:hypothetical protein
MIEAQYCEIDSSRTRPVYEALEEEDSAQEVGLYASMQR